MTTAAVIYLVGVPVVTLIGAAYSELERQRSTNPADREATLKPGLDGIVVGICWPLLAALGVLAALFWIVSRAGRLVVTAMGEREARDG